MTATGRPSLAWWGMALVAATEAVLFAVLVSSYFYLRWRSDRGWPPGDMPEPKMLRPTIAATVLVAGAGAMAAAHLAVRRGRGGALLGALLMTLVLGGVFVGLQAWDLAEMTKEFVPQENAYASLAYMLPGAHAAHVAFGLLALSWITARAARGAYTAERHTGVSVWALYWYSMAALSVLVWATVVLSPRM